MRKPYIGITGPSNVQETAQICQEFARAGYTMNSPHIPMLGFLASYKTLNNIPIKNRRYPDISEIPRMLRATRGQVFTMIHYNSNEPELSQQISQVFKGIYEDNLCRALQLNIVWPDINQLRVIKNQFPELQIVFQASQKAVEGKNPEQITAGVKSYGNLIDYVLIDPSGGRGEEFNIESSLAIYKSLRQETNLTIGFAGGFSEHNVEVRVNKLIGRIGNVDFCTDSEGALRNKLSLEYGDDLLNIGKVKNYLQAHSRILK